MQVALQMSVYYTVMQHTTLSVTLTNLKYLKSISLHLNFGPGSGSHQESFAVGTGLIFWG